MFNFSPLELTIVALIVIVLFGAKRLPELGQGLGKAISNFRSSYKEGQTIDVTPEDKGSDNSESSKSE